MKDELGLQGNNLLFYTNDTNTTANTPITTNHFRDFTSRSVLCANTMVKVANRRALEQDNDLYFFFQNFKWNRTSLEDLISYTYRKTAPLGDYEAACEWIKEHQDEALKFVQITPPSHDQCAHLRGGPPLLMCRLGYGMLPFIISLMFIFFMICCIVVFCMKTVRDQKVAIRTLEDNAKQLEKTLKERVFRLRKQIRENKKFAILKSLIVDQSTVSFDTSKRTTVIGEGAFGVVVRGKFNGQVAAFKVLRKSTDVAVEKFLEEVRRES